MQANAIKPLPTHHILFRKSFNVPIQDYELQTLKFGLNCAPIETLHKTAKDIHNTHPNASTNLRDVVNTADVLAGMHTAREVVIAQERLITALKSASFPL